jgi:2-polyprenyl-3-methyl-5-hydroxy-6-metoxy-1,4-benzoquinol methylase
MSALKQRSWRNLLPFGSTSGASREALRLRHRDQENHPPAAPAQHAPIVPSAPNVSSGEEKKAAEKPNGWWDLLPFTSHRIPITEDLWTADKGMTAYDDARIEILLQFSGGSFQGKTILDLGCNEGAFTAEFARLGAAHVVGIEARPLNYERCEVLRKLLRLPNLEFILGDVKDELPKWQHKPDIILLSGLLYHLSDPYSMLKVVQHTARDIVLIDTHIADTEKSTHGCSELMTRSWGGHEYRGRSFPEYPPDISKAAHEQMLWAAWSNENSFWLLEEDLLRMARDIGFSSAEEIDYKKCKNEWHVDKTNRILVLCRK